MRTIVRRTLLMLLLLAVAGGVWFVRAGGRYLLHEDPLQKADAVYVLGGSRVERWLEAYDLYREGYAPLIVLSPERAEPAETLIRSRGRPRGGGRNSISSLSIPSTNVAYGVDPKFNVIDLWKAKSDRPTPLVIFIHGGGFGGGSKEQILTQLPLDEFLKAGVSCASIDYRRLQWNPGPRQIIYPTNFLDCARAVQFLRHKAKEWNLDPTRFACAGGSAGAGMSLWIGFHKDLADPKSDDPVSRESTRLTCVAVFNAQTAYDPRWIKENLPGRAYQTPNIWQLVGMNCPKFGSPSEQFDELFKAITPEQAKLMEDCSPINHLTAESPPVFLHYLGKSLKPRQNESDDIHQIGFALRLKEKMDALKVDCVISAGWPANPETTGPDRTELEFVLRHFGIKKQESPHGTN